MTTYAGTIYSTPRNAALAFAADMLPDLSVIDSAEPAEKVAIDLEAYCHREASQSGAAEIPEGLTEETWRALCRGAIRARIEAHRAGRRAVGVDVDELAP